MSALSIGRFRKRSVPYLCLVLLLCLSQTALAIPASSPALEELRPSAAIHAEKVIEAASAVHWVSVAEEKIEKEGSDKDGFVKRVLRHDGKKYRLFEETREKGGVTTVRRYDELGRLVYSMDKDARKREDAVYHYDLSGQSTGRTVTMAGAGGQLQIRSEVQVNGRWKTLSLVDARSGTYAMYDAFGRVTQRIDEKGNLWNFEYTTDSKGRMLLQKSFTNGSLVQTDEYRYTDDKKGFLTAKEHLQTRFRDGKVFGKSQTSFEFFYDQKGRLEQTVERRSDGMTIETFHKTGRRVVSDKLGQVWTYQDSDLVSFLDTQKRLTQYTYHRFEAGHVSVTVRIGVRSDGHRTVDVTTQVLVKPTGKLGNALAKSLFEDKEVAAKLKKALVVFEQGQLASLVLKAKDAVTKIDLGKSGGLENYLRSDKSGEVKITSDGGQLVRTVTPNGKSAPAVAKDKKNTDKR